MQAAERVGPLLVITEDPDLTEQLQRLSAAAGVSPEIAVGPAAARRSWRRAAGILVGADAAETVAAAGMPRREGVVLVSTAQATPLLWQRGLALHADSVVVLPQAAPDLVARLSDFVDGGQASCVTVGVVAARGGGGASTLAAGLAMTAARHGVRTLLLDADPLGGGIDLVVGCEDLAGLRWPEVAVTSGRVSSAALRGALPVIDDLAVLSWDRSAPAVVDVETMRSILSAGQRGSRFLPVDLPRRLDGGASEAAACCDVLLLICPTDVRSIAGAAGMVLALRDLATDIRLVVRSGAGPMASADALSDLLELPLLGTVPTRRAIARSIDDGLGVPARGPLAGACRQLLRHLGVVGAMT